MKKKIHEVTKLNLFETINKKYKMILDKVYEQDYNYLKDNWFNIMRTVKAYKVLKKNKKKMKINERVSILITL